MKVLIDDTILFKIANSIRTRGKYSKTYKPSEMPNAIRGILDSEEFRQVTLNIESSIAPSINAGAINHLFIFAETNISSE